MQTNWYLIRLEAGRVIALESDSHEAAAEAIRDSGAHVLLTDEPGLIAFARTRGMVLEVHPSPPREIRRQLRLAGVPSLLALAS
jgi:hypothetical protein